MGSAVHVSIVECGRTRPALRGSHGGPTSDKTVSCRRESRPSSNSTAVIARECEICTRLGAMLRWEPRLFLNVPVNLFLRATPMSRLAPVLFLLSLGATVSCAAENNSRQEVFGRFEKKIRPLLVEHCYSCHSSQSETVRGGLRLDTAEAVARGGNSGPVIDSANPPASLLLRAIRYEGDLHMPPAGQLAPAVIAELTTWVNRGAPFPPSMDGSQSADGGIDFVAGRQFWSFQPATPQPVPRVRRKSWPNSRIDHFVLAAMEASGLEPSPRANRATLIRRLSFDLPGLPPTPEEVGQFVDNDSPRAYEELVENLLQSPHYGEKWGRMWLDLARYTDKTASWLYATGQAHLYRDWVVKAFNDGMPFDDFIHRQLATDLMPETGPDDLPALGFISLSPTYWKELKLPCEIIKTIVADEWEERVDALSRTFLGLTVACARCHDHKFDPISSADYYALAGVFASCRQAERPIIPDTEYEPIKKAKAEVEKLQAEIEMLDQQDPPPQEQIDAITTKIDMIKLSTPRYDTPLANVVTEESLHIVRAGKTAQEGTQLDYRPKPRNLPLFVRGNPNRPGPVVPRRFLTVLSATTDQSTKPKPFQNGSGRLELAQAITTDAASLAARVLVNRIWLAHFGQGLVATPSNFGAQGSRPTHPELLEDLAARFIAGGWSIKQLHRDILLSSTWQQSSDYDETKSAVDPENRWLSRMNRHRLSFEAWRDAMLSASGVLDLSMGGPSVELDSAENHRRTIYATVHRRDMSTTLTIHDFPDPTQHSPSRSFTTTPLQGLYALNGPLLAQQSDRLAKRLRCEFADDDQARIDRAYGLLYSRAPTENEKQLGSQFLGDVTEKDRVARWKQYLHVLLASNELLIVD